MYYHHDDPSLSDSFLFLPMTVRVLQRILARFHKGVLHQAR